MVLKTKKINLGGVDAFRVSIVVEGTGEEKFEIGMERIQHGFGLTENKALEDFIRRNSFLIMDAIYAEPKEENNIT